MFASVAFDPLIPVAAIAVLAALALGAVLLALWRGLSGWPIRALVALALLAALLNPSLVREERAPRDDVVLMVLDRTASNRIDGRDTQTERAAAALAERLEALGGVELRRIEVGDAPPAQDAGTRMAGAIAQALADIPASRLSAVMVITDGRIEDAARIPDPGVPVHQLLTGRAGEWDRRIVLSNAPPFAIVGEEVAFTLRIEDQGAVPAAIAARGEAEVFVSIDGGDERAYTLPVGRDIEVPIVLDHAGLNVMQFRVAALDGELTARNNLAALAVNGIRDRLRVLLVSGEPHPGERTWRNLLKADGSVDLVHFTILRPPNKQDGVPVTELSLIAFPTRELFVEKIDEFDLIIFDRYRRRGILPSLYFDNIARYAENGGAVLVSAGPEFAGAESIWRSPLAEILPAVPTARLLEGAFRPAVTALGLRHPVLRGLEGANAREGEPARWGHWLRQVELEPESGQILMTGAEDAPLVILDRIGAGRVALLASDHPWLWDRGFDGGGPQAELLRRLAHWLMREPELEEEALHASAAGGVISIERTTLGERAGPVSVTAPDGTVTEVPLVEAAPGVFSGSFSSDQLGIFRLADGEIDTVVANGPATPREFEQTVADEASLAALVAARKGGTVRLENGVPEIRRVREGRVAAGRGWIGIIARDAYETLDIRLLPLVSALAFLFLGMALSVLAWLREGRR